MTKIARVRRCLRMARNDQGRDLVVGDLHGHRSLLEAELARLRFDPLRDRVLSVGDLVDRGPESLETLALIEEPWFFAVLGNHELMLLNFLGCYESRLHSRKSYPHHAGEWVGDAVAKHLPALSRLASKLVTLPLAIHVDADVPFNVTHGDLDWAGSKQKHLFAEETSCVHKADLLTTSRTNVDAGLRLPLLDLCFAHHPVRVSPTPLAELPITYVGHTPMRQIMVHNSHVCIDQGVCANAARQAGVMLPTILEHGGFAQWLGGVAAARGAAAGLKRREESESGCAPVAALS